MKIPIERTYKTHGRPMGWGSSAETDWKIMFSIFAMFIIIALFLSFRLFTNTVRELSVEPVTEDFSPIREGVVRRTSDFFEMQRLKSDEVRSTPETLQDPSI